MKKIAMIIGILSILATNANACHGGAFKSGEHRNNSWKTYGKVLVFSEIYAIAIAAHEEMWICAAC